MEEATLNWTPSMEERRPQEQEQERTSPPFCFKNVPADQTRLEISKSSDSMSQTPGIEQCCTAATVNLTDDEDDTIMERIEVYRRRGSLTSCLNEEEMLLQSCTEVCDVPMYLIA